jgi:hypothetical protein
MGYMFLFCYSPRVARRNSSKRKRARRTNATNAHNTQARGERLTVKVSLVSLFFLARQCQSADTTTAVGRSWSASPPPPRSVSTRRSRSLGRRRTLASRIRLGRRSAAIALPTDCAKRAGARDPEMRRRIVFLPFARDSADRNSRETLSGASPPPPPPSSCCKLKLVVTTVVERTKCSVASGRQQFRNFSVRLFRIAANANCTNQCCTNLVAQNCLLKIVVHT